MQKILGLFENQKDQFNSNFNYLLGISMFYMMFMILSGITVYKLVRISYFEIPAAVLITPFTYSLSNVITEVYGYRLARHIMWWFVIVSAFFSMLSFLLISLPSPVNFENQYAFKLILGNMPLVFLAGTIGTICGISFNNFFISKFKVILEGRKYWLRSIISTAAGEIVYNLIAYPLMWLGKIPIALFLKILLSVSLFKILMTAIIWPFECFLASFLKLKEGINVIDKNISYNIFEFKIKKSIKKPNLKIVK